MIACVVGPDHSMARTEAQRIARTSDPSGDNTSWLDGQTASMSLRDVLMAVSSVGFFSLRRTIVVEGLMTRLSRSATKPDSRSGGSDPTGWSELMSGVPAANTLVLLDPALASVPAALKRTLPEAASVFIADPPRGSALVSWIQDRARASQSEIDTRTARDLASRLFPQGWSARSNNPAFDRPPDLEALGHEIDKLATAAHPDAITMSTIANLTPSIENDQVFKFIDAVTAGNVSAAVTELDRLLAVGEDPHKLLAQVAQSAELGVVMANAGRRAPADVGKAIKLGNANRMNAIARGLERGGATLSNQTIGIVERVDRQLKTGEIRDPVDALHALITGIAAKVHAIRGRQTQQSRHQP